MEHKSKKTNSHEKQQKFNSLYTKVLECWYSAVFMEDLDFIIDIRQNFLENHSGNGFLPIFIKQKSMICLIM